MSTAERADGGLLILGAGGHGRVIADAAELAGHWSRIAFLDDRYPALRSAGPWEVLGALDRLTQLVDDYTHAVAAFGQADLRLSQLQRIEQTPLRGAVVIHPSAVVSRHAQLEPGTVVFANAAINIGARIARGCIINTGAAVDHDCELAEGVHICPGVHLAGSVRVGARAWIGIGAAVKQNVTIGADATVGAGAVCIRDVGQSEVVAGVPARVLRTGRDAS